MNQADQWWLGAIRCWTLAPGPLTIQRAHGRFCDKIEIFGGAFPPELRYSIRDCFILHFVDSFLSFSRRDMRLCLRLLQWLPTRNLTTSLSAQQLPPTTLRLLPNPQRPRTFRMASRALQQTATGSASSTADVGVEEDAANVAVAGVEAAVASTSSHTRRPGKSTFVYTTIAAQEYTHANAG